MPTVFKRGDNYWVDFYDVDRKRRRLKIGPDKNLAKEALKSYVGKVARKEHLGAIEDSTISFADFTTEWVKRVGPTLRPRTKQRWVGMVENHLKPFFDGPLRAAVTAAQVATYITKRTEAGAAAETLIGELKLLRHIMIRAVAWGYLSKNPLRDVQGRPIEGTRGPKLPPGRVRYLDQDELQRFLTECAKDRILDAFVKIALNTGMRRGEILSLTGASIDWAQKTATIALTKNGEARTVPLNPVAFEALKSLPRPVGDTPFFQIPITTLRDAFQRARRGAEIENFRLHDLRHCFASYQAMAGVQARGLQALLGHKTAAMTVRYSHLSADYLREAVDAVQIGGK